MIDACNTEVNHGGHGEHGAIHLLEYRGAIVGEYYPDLIVENTVVVEIKSVLRMEHVFTAQLLTYLRITGLRVGLILNFNQTVLKDGIKRVVR